MKKFAAEEEKTFHLHLLYSFVFFIDGFMLNPLQWVVRKGKGCICVNCTNASHGVNSPGSPNIWILSPSDEHPDECPPVYYGDAFQCFIHQIWQLCITYPQVLLHQHVDDIDSAFRHILCHLDLAVTFTYVLEAFLIVPVGQMFGSQSAPSFFCQSLDLHAYVATCVSLSAYPHPAILDAMETHAALETVVAQSIADSKNPILSAQEKVSFTNSSFVDDNGMVDLICHISMALHQSVVSATSSMVSLALIGGVIALLRASLRCSSQQSLNGLVLRLIVINCLSHGLTTSALNCLTWSLVSFVTQQAMTFIVQPLLPRSLLPSLENCNQPALWPLGVPIWHFLSWSCCASPFIILWLRAFLSNIGSATARCTLVVNNMASLMPLIAQFLDNDEDPTSVELSRHPHGSQKPHSHALVWCQLCWHWRMVSHLWHHVACYASGSCWSGFSHEEVASFPRCTFGCQEQRLAHQPSGIPWNHYQHLASFGSRTIPSFLHHRSHPGAVGRQYNCLVLVLSHISHPKMNCFNLGHILLPPFLCLLISRTPECNPIISKESGTMKRTVSVAQDDGVIPLWEAMCDHHSRLVTCWICLLPHELFVTLAQLLGSSVTEETLIQKTDKAADSRCQYFGQVARDPATYSPVYSPCNQSRRHSSYCCLPWFALPWQHSKWNGSQ